MRLKKTIYVVWCFHAGEKSIVFAMTDEVDAIDCVNSLAKSAQNNGEQASFGYEETNLYRPQTSVACEAVNAFTFGRN